MASETGAALYDYIKIKFKVNGARRQISGIPDQPWKDFKRQWVVLNTDLSPYDCFLTYCTKEEDWLVNRETMPKLVLKRHKLIRYDMSVEKQKEHLEIEFEDYSIIMHFTSLSKQQQWFDELERIRCRVYTELVRSPEHPEKEGEYVIEICSDRLKLWDPFKGTVSFEWKLHSVRRAQYHNRTGKVEIEVGRATETGEGHFFFIGHEIKDLFYKIKDSITLLSTAASVKRKGENLPVRNLSDLKQSSPQVVQQYRSSTDEDSTGGTDDGSSSAESAGISLVPLVPPPYSNSNPASIPLPPKRPPPEVPPKFNSYLQKLEPEVPMSSPRLCHEQSESTLHQRTLPKNCTYQKLLDATKNMTSYYESPNFK